MQSNSEGGRSANFLYAGDDVQEGCIIDLTDTYPHLEAVFENERRQVYATKSAEIHGLQYRVGCILVLKYENDDPCFGMLLDIIVFEHDKYFILEKVTSQYDNHILGYMVSLTGQRLMVSYYDLEFKWPLVTYKYQQRPAVMNVCSHTCEL